MDHKNLYHFIDIKTGALHMFNRLKNYFSTIFGLIIVKIRLIKLLILFLDTFNGIFRHKYPKGQNYQDFRVITDLFSNNI